MSENSKSSENVVSDIVINEAGGLMEDTFRRHEVQSGTNVSRPNTNVEDAHRMISELESVVSRTLDGMGQYSKDDFIITHIVINERVAPCAACNNTPILLSRENTKTPISTIEYAVRCLAHTREHGTLFEAKRKSAIIAKWNHMQVRLKHLSVGHLQNTSEGRKLAHGTIKKLRRIS